MGGIEAAAIGVCAGQVMALAWDGSAWPLALLAVAIGCWWGLAPSRRRGAALVAVALLAAALALERTAPLMRGIVPSNDVGARPSRHVVTLRGVVREGPTTDGTRSRIVIEAVQRVRGNAFEPAVGQLRVVVPGRVRHLRTGDRVQLTARVRAPRSFANPGGFDSSGYLARHGIHATAFLPDASDLRRIAARRRTVVTVIAGWRRRIGATIRATVPEPARGVLAALVVGDERAVDPRLRDAFSRAGVVHLLSVSGLHIALVAASVAMTLAWLLGRSERLLLTVDVTQLGRLLALPAVMTYALLAGLAVPTLRAVVMAGAATVAGLAGRRTSITRLLALAALVLAIARPGCALDAGFQLSFLSVLALALGGGTRGAVNARAPRWSSWVWSSVRASAVASLATAPLTAFHFHQISLVGPIVNPVVIPLFGAIVVGPGLLGALLEPMSPPLAAQLFRVAGLALTPGLSLVDRLGSMPSAAVSTPLPDGVELTIAYAALVAFWLLPHATGRALLVAACAAALTNEAWRRYAVNPSATRVTFLDVGQGDAAVIELPRGRTVLVDAGGLPGTALDTGATIVEPFLLARRQQELAAVVVTHAHPDHFAGLISLLDRGWARELWWNGRAAQGQAWQALEEVVARRGIKKRALRAGDVPPLAGFAPVVHPAGTEEQLSVNDGSLTLRLAAPPAVLLTGDIEEAAERSILARGSDIASAVLKVPHHGSRTSSTPAFLAAVRPLVAIISVGYENRYGLPASGVEARYRANGVCVLRTDRCGAVTAELTAGGLRVWAERPACACPAGPTPPA